MVLLGLFTSQITMNPMFDSMMSIYLTKEERKRTLAHLIGKGLTLEEIKCLENDCDPVLLELQSHIYDLNRQCESLETVMDAKPDDWVCGVVTTHKCVASLRYMRNYFNARGYDVEMPQMRRVRKFEMDIRYKPGKCHYGLYSCDCDDCEGAYEDEPYRKPRFVRGKTGDQVILLIRKKKPKASLTDCLGKDGSKLIYGSGKVSLYSIDAKQKKIPVVPCAREHMDLMGNIVGNSPKDEMQILFHPQAMAFAASPAVLALMDFVSCPPELVLEERK